MRPTTKSLAGALVLGLLMLSSARAARAQDPAARGEDNVVRGVGGIELTIKEGIVYDARQLLGDVRTIVREANDREGFEITPPGRGPFR